MSAERFIRFPCGVDTLAAILHEGKGATGVVVVVGGFQYRVGSHRQFVLLARELAAAGIPTLRFDCRGMGDSSGHFRGFEYIEDDIRSAIDAFHKEQPGLDRVVLWGLCNAAASNLFYAAKDPRVAGLVLINPWVRTEEGLARTILRHYYIGRILSAAFWRRLFRGEVRIGASVGSLARAVWTVLGGRPKAPLRPEATADLVKWGELGLPDESLPERMRDGLRRFRGPVLFQLSQNDLTGREFDGMWKRARAWRRLMARANVTIHYLPNADHTYTTREHLDEASRVTRDWVKSL
jgi:exosortase A-associated hydrolase 1